MVMEQREHRQVDIVALDGHVLAGRGIHHLRLKAQLRSACDLKADLGCVAIEREGVHRSDAIGIGEERELAVLDALDKDRGVGICFHERGQFVDPLFFVDPCQKSRLI